MEKRSDRYKEHTQSENIPSSRVNRNRLLYDEINSKIGIEEIPTFEADEEINLSSIDMDNLNRSEYQKVKDFKEIIDVDEKKVEEKPKEEPKSKSYDINKVLEEAKKNRKADELENRRSIKEEDYNALNNLNKKYLHQKGFTEEDNEELKELIDTITSKTMVDDIKDEEEKELLSELLATTIDIKLESELSETQIQALADEKIENELVDTNSFYSKSLELSKEDLVSENDAVEKEDEEETNILGFEEEKTNVAKIIFISLVLLIILLLVVYFVLHFLGIKF
jgi:hypothetical protein